MQFIIRTTFNLAITCEIVKVGDAHIFYKQNITDKIWLTIPANDVKYVQLTGHRNGLA